MVEHVDGREAMGPETNPQVLDASAANDGAAATLLMERRKRHIRAVLQTYGRGVAFYSAILFADLMTEAAAKIPGQASLHGFTAILTIDPETGAVMLTGLITASIAFNLLIDQSRKQVTERSSVPRMVETLLRLLFLSFGMDLLAVLSVVIGIAVLAQAFSRQAGNLIGATASLVLSLISVLLAVDSGNIYSVVQLRQLVQKQHARSELARLQRIMKHLENYGNLPSRSQNLLTGIASMVGACAVIAVLPSAVVTFAREVERGETTSLLPPSPMEVVIFFIILVAFIALGLFTSIVVVGAVRSAMIRDWLSCAYGVLLISAVILSFLVAAVDESPVKLSRLLAAACGVLSMVGTGLYALFSIEAKGKGKLFSCHYLVRSCILRRLQQRADLFVVELGNSPRTTSRSEPKRFVCRLRTRVSRLMGDG